MRSGSVLTVTAVLSLACLQADLCMAADAEAVKAPQKAEIMAVTAGSWHAVKSGRNMPSVLVMDGKGGIEARDSDGKVRCKGQLAAEEEHEGLYIYSFAAACPKAAYETTYFYVTPEEGLLDFGHDGEIQYRKKQ